MSKTSWVAESRRGWILLACDAFLFAGALFLAAMALLEAVAFLGGWQPAPQLEWLNLIVLITVVFGGALIALWLHAVRLHGMDWLVMALGAVAGGTAISAAVFGLFGLLSFVPLPRTLNEGPWLLVVVVALLILAVVIPPAWAAIGSLIAGRDRGLAWARIVALVVMVAGVAVSLGIGGETAEAGAFMVPFGVGAACAALAVSLLQDRWGRRSATTAPTGPA